MRPPMLLTGGPAVGKSATALRLASTSRLAAVIDVDDVRHLVVAGHAAPWEGSAGQRQQQVGVENAADMARRFLDNDIEVLLTDVVDERTLPIYRHRLPDLIVVRLSVEFGEAQRRATLRPLHLTASQFADLHRREVATTPLADQVIEVTHMTLDSQAAAVLTIWPDGESASPGSFCQ